ncbi:hypothetical protein [Microvirga aerilata]|uniref:hypothetical protein n=1 Tax=Microvirga aerilata TaxID=670292 RepID=UPI001FEAA7EF|nr:hypothetical protein [Microvirga aerilata]
MTDDVAVTLPHNNSILFFNDDAASALLRSLATQIPQLLNPHVPSVTKTWSGSKLTAIELATVEVVTGFFRPVAVTGGGIYGRSRCCGSWIHGRYIRRRLLALLPTFQPLSTLKPIWPATFIARRPIKLPLGWTVSHRYLTGNRCVGITGTIATIPVWALSIL